MNIISYFRDHKTAKSGANYSLASSLSSGMTMLITLLSMRWLGPELLGAWQSLTVVNFYIVFMQLGIQSGLNLELPLLLGQNQKEQAEKHVSTALTFAISLATLFLALGLPIIGYLYVANKSQIFINSAIAILVLTIVGCFKLHYIATYRSAIAFDKLAKIFYIDIFVNVIFIPIIYCLSYDGYLLYQVGKELFLSILMFIYAPYRQIKPRFDRKTFLNLFKRGVFMTIVNQIKGFIESSSRVLILYFANSFVLGLFTPALSIRTVMDMIPSQISQFLNPQFGYKYGQTKKAMDMWLYLKKAFIFIPIACIPVVICGWFLLPWILEVMFPKYIDSLWPIRITLIGFIFSSTYISRGFLITIKAYKETITLYTIDVLLFFLVPYMIVKCTSNDVLISISIGMSVSYFISYLLNMFVVRYTIFKEKYNV